MKLLISVVDANEARSALMGGADIIDVKNPAEGALGAAGIEALREVCALLPAERLPSAALGEAADQPGVFALAAFGAATLGARYVKVGLRIAQQEQAVSVLQAVRQGARMANPACLVIAVGYADAERVAALPWALLPETAAAAGIDGCMIDTAVKDGQNLFDTCEPPALQRWLAACRAANLRTALAGSLRASDLAALRELCPDVVGFRGAACRGDRVSGRVDAALVAALRAGLGLEQPRADSAAAF